MFNMVNHKICRESTSLTLVGHPSSNVVTVKIPYAGVNGSIALTSFAAYLFPSLSFLFVETESESFNQLRIILGDES